MAVSSEQAGPTELVADRNRSARLIFYIVLTASFLDSIDYFIVLVAVPSIQVQFAASIADTQWVIGAYGITLAGFLLLVGRAGDIYGQKRIFVTGMAVFTASSLAAGLSPSLPALIAARLAQGLGAAMTTVPALAIFIGLFRDEYERLKYYGIFVASFAAGASVGIVAGGLLTFELGWRSVLFVNVPIGVLVTFLAQRYLAGGGPVSKGKKLDLGGAVTITCGLILLVYALTLTANGAFGSPVCDLTFAASVATVGLFFLIESRSAEPLLPLGFLREGSTLSVNALCFFVTCTSGVGVLVTYYFQRVLGWSVFYAAIGTLPLTLCVLVGGGWAAAKIQGKLGLRRTLLTSTSLLTAGAVWLTQISDAGNYWTVILPGLVVFGMGAALVFPAIFAEAGALAKRGQEGLASGVVNTSFRIAFPVGLAVVLTAVGLTQDPQLAISSQSLAAGLRYGFVVVVGFCLLSVLTAIRIRSYERRP